MRLLLESGAAIENRREDGDTPLIVAAAYGDTDAVKSLLEKGADVAARDKEGSTALVAAACESAMATILGRMTP